MKQLTKRLRFLVFRDYRHNHRTIFNAFCANQKVWRHQVIPDADAADHLAENEMISVWNDLPETSNFLKSSSGDFVDFLIYSYYCKSLFSTMNSIKSDIRNSLTDDLSAAGVESSFEK